MSERTGDEARVSRAAASKAADLGAGHKRAILHRIADAVADRLDEIRTLNETEADEARTTSARPAKELARLVLHPQRLARIVKGIGWLADAPDPVGAMSELQPQPSGLLVGRMRVPLGVVVTVYESRPEVTLEAAALGIKSGNAIILRGGRESTHTNRVLAGLVRECLAAEGVDPDIVQYVSDTSRDALWRLLTSTERLDLIVARGSEAFVQRVSERSPYPVLTSGGGNCHIFIDSDADLDSATQIVLNAKLSAPTMCNAVETVLVHADHTETYLPMLLAHLRDAGVALRGCPIVVATDTDVPLATTADWSTEYLDLTLAVRVVPHLEAAIEHINTYGTRHSEAIVTASIDHARRFQYAVDAAVVYVNASTRFTYGYELGLGPMLGISTQKLHTRGPITMRDLTSEKFVVTGSGQLREAL